MTYGYDHRTDPPGAGIPGGRALPAETPETRVTSPPRLESRAVQAAIKAEPEREPYLVTQLMTGNGVVPIGNTWLTGGGGAGAVVSTYGWQDETNRYGRRLQVTGTVAFGAGYHSFAYANTITPRAWLDPLWVGSRGPAIVRISDVLRFKKDSAPTTQGYVAARFGFGSLSSESMVLLKNFCGFYCHITDGASTGTWQCVSTDATPAALYSSDTGIDTAALHKLEVELNAEQGTVRWYIDDVQVGEWAPGSAQAAADGGAVAKRILISVQAQEKAPGLWGIGTLDFGLDGWLVAAASFDSPDVG